MNIIDQEIIDGLIEIGDKDFLIELIDIFLVQSEELVNEIKQAAGESNAGELMKASHKLKGSCLNLGAGELGNICQQLEAKSKTEDLSDIKNIIQPLDSVYQKTCSELNKYK